MGNDFLKCYVSVNFAWVLCVWVIVMGRRYENFNRYWICRFEDNYLVLFLIFIIKLKIFNLGGFRGIGCWKLGNVISMWSLEKWI